MNRRRFLVVSSVLTALCGVPIVAAEPAVAEEALPLPNGLTPSGIKVTGIRLLLVVGGKHKVWTKKWGSGLIKALLLHCGPAATHSYLEVMESFLPQAGTDVLRRPAWVRELGYSERPVSVDAGTVQGGGGGGTAWAGAG